MKSVLPAVRDRGRRRGCVGREVLDCMCIGDDGRKGRRSPFEGVMKGSGKNGGSSGWAEHKRRWNEESKGKETPGRKVEGKKEKGREER